VLHPCVPVTLRRATCSAKLRELCLVDCLSTGVRIFSVYGSKKGVGQLKQHVVNHKHIQVKRCVAENEETRSHKRHWKCCIAMLVMFTSVVINISRVWHLRGLLVLAVDVAYVA
jgi:hypothetical protein